MRFRGFPQAAAAPHGTPKLSYRPSSEVEPEAAEPPVAQRYLSAEPAAPSPTEDICTPLRAGLRQLPGLRVRRAIRVELHAAIVTVHVVMRLRHRSISGVPSCLQAAKRKCTTIVQVGRRVPEVACPALDAHSAVAGSHRAQPQPKTLPTSGLDQLHRRSRSDPLTGSVDACPEQSCQVRHVASANVTQSKC